MTSTKKMAEATNEVLQVSDDAFVYRHFGADSPSPPLVMLQHFRGNLDNWDPAFVDRLAVRRQLILVDNRGVGGSSGVVRSSVTAMAKDVLDFIAALGLPEVDILGFSLGGHMAQEVALLRPRNVRRLVLAATAPRGAPNLRNWPDDVHAHATPDQPSADDALALFFSSSNDSRARGLEYLQRAYARQEDRDQPTDLATRDAQLVALMSWGIPDHSKLARLTDITQPTLIANGDSDPMMRTENSYLLAGLLPVAQIRIYPDAGHGFLYQYPELFATHVNEFLDG